MKNNHQPMSQINVVPYVDVMLVLLVIFMITTPLIMQGVKVDLPQAEAKAVPEQSRLPIIITVDKAGQYFLNVSNNGERPLALNALGVRIAAELKLDAKRGVFVRGDSKAQYGAVVAVMGWLKQAGVDNVGLVTQPFEKGQ